MHPPVTRATRLSITHRLQGIKFDEILDLTAEVYLLCDIGIDVSQVGFDDAPRLIEVVRAALFSSVEKFGIRLVHRLTICGKFLQV